MATLTDFHASVTCPSFPTGSSVSSTQSEQAFRSRYEFGPQIGKGRFGVVYEAVDVHTGAIVAIKCVSLPRANALCQCGCQASAVAVAAGELAMVRSEAEICRSLCSTARRAGQVDVFGDLKDEQDACLDSESGETRVVKVLEVVETDRFLFIVMEKCNGGSLEDYLRSRPSHTQQAVEDEAAWMVWEIAAATAFCHRNGVLHRDIKPANVLLSYPTASAELKLPSKPTRSIMKRIRTLFNQVRSRGRVAPVHSLPSSPKHPASFGVAPLPQSEPASPLHQFAPPVAAKSAAKPSIQLADFGLAEQLSNAKATAQSGLVGSPYYLSPEVAAGLPASFPSDVWGIGMCLYAALSGEDVPFHGVDKQQLLQEVVRAAVPVNEGRMAALSEAAKEVVNKLLEAEASKRPTAEQLMQEPWVEEGRARWMQRNGWA